jgi:hypothetical protein
MLFPLFYHIIIIIIFSQLADCSCQYEPLFINYSVKRIDEKSPYLLLYIFKLDNHAAGGTIGRMKTPLR